MLAGCFIFPFFFYIRVHVGHWRVREFLWPTTERIQVKAVEVDWHIFARESLDSHSNLQAWSHKIAQYVCLCGCSCQISLTNTLAALWGSPSLYWLSLWVKLVAEKLANHALLHWSSLSSDPDYFGPRATHATSLPVTELRSAQEFGTMTGF